MKKSLAKQILESFSICEMAYSNTNTTQLPYNIIFYNVNDLSGYPNPVLRIGKNVNNLICEIVIKQNEEIDFSPLYNEMDNVIARKYEKYITAKRNNYIHHWLYGYPTSEIDNAFYVSPSFYEKTTS